MALMRGPFWDVESPRLATRLACRRIRCKPEIGILAPTAQVDRPCTRYGQAKGDGMKIVVIGGTGLVGSKLVEKLRSNGHEAIAASLDTGVNILTGEGLADALDGAEVLVDVSNAPNWADDAVLDFFETSSRNLLAAAANAGVKHYVALSVVGAERLSGSGYMRAKVAQEALVEAGSVPYTILRASQFFEFIGRIAGPSGGPDPVHLSPAFVQPESSDDVAA